MKKEFVFLVFLLFVFSFASLCSASIGVSPASYSIDFKPGLKSEMYFDFRQDRDINLEVYAEGDLAQYVSFSKKKIEGSGRVDVSLRLPKEIEIPGPHTIYIGARQVIPEGNGFGISGNIRGIIRVVVPYPGQYATIAVNAKDANAGENIDISADIRNLGSESVKAEAKVSIYRADKYITELDFGSFDLSSPDQRTISREINTKDYAPGNYNAFGKLLYGDGLVAESNDSFRLGELFVSIVNYSNELERDKLNRFEINVQSQWNDPIEGVYANVTVPGYPISFLTPSANIQGFGTTTLTGFFDTTGIVGDSFDAVIRVNYAGKTTENLVNIKFKKERDYLMIALIAGAVIILGLVIFLTYIIRRVEKRRK